MNAATQRGVVRSAARAWRRPAASVSHEHRFGFIGHSLAGLVGGALSGSFLQSLATTILNGSGSENSSSAAEIAVIHVVTGGVAGAIAMFAVGIFKKG